jgi:hypothetical protein
MNQGLGSIGQTVSNLPIMYYYGSRGGFGSGGAPTSGGGGMWTPEMLASLQG